jgi:hypothetical protein
MRTVSYSAVAAGLAVLAGFTAGQTVFLFNDPRCFWHSVQAA